MGNVISVIDALAEEKTGGENIEPKVMTADLAQSLYAGELRVPVNANMPRTGAMTNFMYGLVDTTDAFVNDTPEQIKILGGQYDVVMGGLKGDEERIKRGRMNMDTANRNLQFNQQQRDMLTPNAAKDTFGYALGSGVASYGTMVVGGYGGGAAARALGASAKAAGRATGAAAYGTMAAMEVGGEVQERADKYAADTGDSAFKNYEPEKALKNLAAESAYGTISVILEKYLGFGEQRKLFNLDLAKLKSPTLRATASLTKTGVKTAVSEAGTEFAQSLANMGIDLIDGTMDWEQVPDRLKQELTGWAAAAVIGGTAGVGVGIYNRSRGIRAIKEEIRGTVPDADLERTASAIFDSAAEKMADVVSVELELSSQLRNKHGSVMDSMQRAVKQAVDESGAFADIGEDVLAEYVVDTSKLFADQVLAEANIRNVPIEEVIKASDIVYENGGIRLKSQTGGGESRVLADSSVNVEGEQQLLLQEAYDSDGKADINTPEFKAWFGNSKVVDEKGRPKTYWHGSLWNFDRFKQHNGDYNFSPDERFAYNYAESKAFEQGIDNDVTVYPVYIKAEKPFDSNNAEDIDFVKKITEGKKIRVFRNEKTQEEFIDEIQGYYQDTPLREGEFEKITQDDFPKWYSKYNHNIDYSQSSVAEYKVLEVNEKDGYFIAAKPPFRADMEDVESEIREKMKDVDFSKGETNISVSYETPYGTRVGDAYVMKVYKPSPEHRKKGADNWIYLESADIDGVDFTDILKENGYDGYYKVEHGIENLSVFEPNQIKSVYNRGAFDQNNDNIYYQKAYAGSRVDYEKPSLEAIGSGEGNQAHGWGLYYALDKDVAEGYRERFINEYGEGIVEYNGVVYKNNDDYAHFLLNLKQTKKGEIARQREIAKFFNENGNIELAKKHKKLAEEGENINVDDIKTLGQVHEVEIPENPFLLDEQLPFSEQPEIVKQGIKNAIKEISEDAEKQIQALENKDFIGREIYNKISLFLAKTPGTLADKETSLLLEKYGIKGITYDGRQDGRAFVIFNPDDVQVIQKFYQKGIAKNAVKITGKEFGEYDGNDKAYIAKARQWYRENLTGKSVTSPVIGEVNFYNRQFGETKDKNIKNIENLKYLPAVRQIIETSSSVQEEKPNHFRRDDVVQFYRITAPVDINGEVNSVSVLIAEDIQGRKYYTLENKGLAQDTSVERGLAQAQKGNAFYDLNIYVNKENVKTNNTSTNLNPKGLYDASKGIIRIFETADFSTLPHEMAHYWLDNMWSYVRSGNASEKYRQRWNVIANWLNVRPEQAILTRGQQEKFARGYEQYLLNGNLPIPIIKGAFDDYDRWLKRVYGDMNRLNIRLSEDAVRFFQSMTTGVLPPPQIKPARKPRGKMTRAEKLREQLGLREQDKQEQEAVKFVEEMEAARPLPDSVDERTVIVSNITEGEPGKSRVYSREVERNIDTLQEIADIDLEYNKIKLEEQAQRAAEYVKNNLEDARKIIDGRKAAPENILDTAIRIAYEQEMLRIGDNAEYLRALKLHSSLQTLRGQEIVAERISTKDIASPTYWINKLVAHRTYKAASKIFKGYAEAVGGDSPVDLYKKMIKNETDRITKKVLAEKTREEQQKVLNAELKRLRYEYGTGVQGELFQLPLEPLNARNAKMYVREALDDIFGTTVSQEEANQIIGKIGEIEKSIVNTLDETGNPSVQTWQKINEMNNLVESLTPSPALQIATSIVGRGMMLSSIKSPVLNIVSNTENILTEMLIRRAVNSLEGGASFSAVDKNVEKDYLAYADDVYRASGYNVSTTEGLDAATVTLGERRISTQGAGKFRAFARGVETGVFKYLMGYPDSRAKDFVFSDTAALEATTIAQNEGLSGEMLSKRATELYRDATRVAPLTEEGMLIREKAMIEANVATYTNDTAFSKFALGIRETLNKVTGNVRLGDQLMPFVKTPANVVALGMEYSIGAAYLIPNLTTVIRDVKAGKLSAKSRTAIKAAVRNGLGVVLAMLIAMALDPDDYTPDYDALTMSERRLALEKNAVFNSIRIGDKYISLDYFGPLAVPLTAVLSARRRGEVAWFGYAKGVASQLQKLPGLQEFSETVDAIGRATSNKPEKTVKNLNNALIDFVRARTIPSIVNDLAKSIDTYERETSAGTYDKAQASVPGIREELPLKYTTTSRTPKETEAALSILLFGARVKTAASNRVIYEIDRLYKKNAKPTITDVTRSGKLSELSEAKQQRVRKEFAKRYYAEVYTLIRTRAYRAKDDEQKAAAINKVRRQIIEQLKKTYIR